MFSVLKQYKTSLTTYVNVYVKLPENDYKTNIS